MKCADTIFDIYDTERVPVGISKNQYYVTPSMIDDIRFWMFDKGINRISTNEELQELIRIGYIKSYAV
jgi:hypothetical protein